MRRIEPAGDAVVGAGLPAKMFSRFYGVPVFILSILSSCPVFVLLLHTFFANAALANRVT